MTRTRLALGSALLFVAAGIVAAGLRLDQVHDYGWEWTLNPSDAPPKVVYDGRNYDRGSTLDTFPAGTVAKDETLGGGTIYVDPDAGTQRVIYVEDGNGQVWTYGLMGGP